MTPLEKDARQNKKKILHYEKKKKLHEEKMLDTIKGRCSMMNNL